MCVLSVHVVKNNEDNQGDTQRDTYAIFYVDFQGGEDLALIVRVEAALSKRREKNVFGVCPPVKF